MNNLENNIKESSDSEFITDVIETSNEYPVIVDFWAPWCGPCKNLTPNLEKIINLYNGKIKLVKINIDENQGVASQLRIQSIPAVFAFFQGKPLDGFMGAQTENQIKEFISNVIKKSGGEVESDLDKILENANTSLENGQIEEARGYFQEILDEDYKNVDANVGIIKSYIAEKNFDEALKKLSSIPKEIEKENIFVELNNEIELLNKVSKTRSSGNIQSDLEKNPDSLDLKFELALSQIANEEYEDSIENLFYIFKIDKSWENGKAKDQLIQLFDTLGNKNELVLKARRRLSSMIFS